MAVWFATKYIKNDEQQNYPFAQRTTDLQKTVLTID